MSRLPNTRKEETHARIVAAAATALRREGYAGVGVADVMKEAGLTHGGFYAHFGSREALLVEALECAGRTSAESLGRAVEQRQARGASAFRGLVESYLSDALLGRLDAGCPVAALGSDMPRQSEALRAAASRRVEGLIAAVRAALPHQAPEAAAVATATLVGSLQLARTLGDNAQGRALLAQAREALISLYDAPASPSSH